MPALDRIAADGWLAVVAPPVLGLSRLREAYGTAIDALAVAIRLGRRGLIEADEVLLERALLADEPLLAAAVAHELGPILGARRNARALLDTLAAYIESAENLRATARRLGVAPRTVAYRLARIEALLGEPVRGARLVRISTALLAARLLPEQVLGTVARQTLPRRAGPSAPCRSGPVPGKRRLPPRRSPRPRAPVDRSRPVPRDRSRSRRGRATGT